VSACNFIAHLNAELLNISTFHAQFMFWSQANILNSFVIRCINKQQLFWFCIEVIVKFLKWYLIFTFKLLWNLQLSEFNHVIGTSLCKITCLMYPWCFTVYLWICLLIWCVGLSTERILSCHWDTKHIQFVQTQLTLLLLRCDNPVVYYSQCARVNV
jgi:hypothetical protein